ncbi:MAG: diguanylate cyclase (GGDEF)-like protein [Candidatus Paceibacteria bacterium]|jgi:diguanylate cyclase (GGDEF)-like protein
MILLCDHRASGLSQALRPLLGAGFELEATENLRESRNRLQAEPYELLVIAPLVNGGTKEIEELWRGIGDGPPPPILLVSDPADPGAALKSAEALNGQVWDVVSADAPVEEFKLRMERLVSHAYQLAELTDLRYRASHDDLTELLRPLYFQARLEEYFSAAERHGLDMTLLVIDLDRFGQINKLYDHTRGDLVLASVARVIRDSLRTEDVAGRIGGDEFAILLPYTGALEGATTVRRLCLTIESLSESLATEGIDFVLSGSIGFETTNGHDIGSLEELRRHAEAALQRAKRAGGNRGVFYRSKDKGGEPS